MNCSNLWRVSEATVAFLSSHSWAAGKRVHPFKGALNTTSLHFGWNGGCCSDFRRSKNIFTKCSTLRYRLVFGAQLYAARIAGTPTAAARPRGGISDG